MAASPLAAALLGEGGGTNMAGLLDPAIAQATPDLQLAQQMLSQGLSTAPASPLQALARVAQAGAGTYLQRNAMGTLTQAYAHNADTLAKIFPPGTPIGNMLNSSDPITRMQGTQLAQKAAVLQSEPYNLEPGAQRKIGGATVGENTNPQSPEGKLQRDLDTANSRNAGGAPAPAQAAPAVARPAVPAGVPLNPPRLPQPGGIESVVGMGSAQPAPGAGVPTSVPNFNERFDASRPSGVAPTSPPSSPLQGAIDVEAKKAAATAQATETAKAGVEYGDLLKPQGPIPEGPGGTQPVTVFHNDPRTMKSQSTVIPGLKEQGSLPNSPAALKEAVPAWQKTETGFTSGLQAGQDAEQRLNSIADAFKTVKSGWGTEQKAHVNAIMKSMGLPQILPNADPAAVEQSLHENYVQTLKRLQSSVQGTGSRFTQMEFKLLSENAEHPDLQPEANLRMLSEDIAQIKQSNSMARDWQIAKSQYGWKNPQAFEQSWLDHNPITGFTEGVRKDIGPLKGMAGNEAGAKTSDVQPPASSADPSARFKQLVSGGMTKEQAFAKMHSEGF